MSIFRRRLRVILAWSAIASLAGCAGVGHQFAPPSGDWQTRSGQLLYRNARTSVIGEVVVRYSNAGSFELTFSKGPGLTLFVINQEENFVRFSGPLARGSWSGPPTQAPARLRGWLQVREKLLANKDRQSIRHVAGAETFLFRF
jgi:hypothetical protein